MTTSIPTPRVLHETLLPALDKLVQAESMLRLMSAAEYYEQENFPPAMFIEDMQAASKAVMRLVDEVWRSVSAVTPLNIEVEDEQGEDEQGGPQA